MTLAAPCQGLIKRTHTSGLTRPCNGAALSSRSALISDCNEPRTNSPPWGSPASRSLSTSAWRKELIAPSLARVKYWTSSRGSGAAGVVTERLRMRWA